MNGYAKLHSNIITSSLWTNEDDATRILWVTMLAMADAQGRVISSIPGIAHIARVPIPKAVEALERFKRPDEWSRTKDNEGRRIEEIEDGWRLLNYAKYREGRDPDARREQVRDAVQRHRERKRADPVIQGNPEVSQRNPGKAQAEAEAEAEAEAGPKGKSSTVVNDYTLSGKPDPSSSESQKVNRISRKAERLERAKPILRALNEATGRAYHETDTNLALIAARLDEPEVTVEGCIQMVRRQAQNWMRDRKMAEYLRPQTLFGKEKFDGYYATKDLEVPPLHHIDRANPLGTSTPDDATF